MTQPKSYEPVYGQKYQLLCRTYGEGWEHCDYAVDIHEKRYLLNEYHLAYGRNYEFKTILFPKKYWPKVVH